jgi:hypothetical protein
VGWLDELQVIAGAAGRAVRTLALAGLSEAPVGIVEQIAARIALAESRRRAAVGGYAEPLPAWWWAYRDGVELGPGARSRS